MSDEEEDYMSDKFLGSLPDVRPSLIQNRAKKRQVEVKKKQNECIKRQREHTSASRLEKLQESLSKPIESQNKGFQLLAKMGYKPGQALGKEQAPTSSSSSCTEKRLLEPIGISIKSDRGGLGREAALEELAEKRRKLRLEHLQRKAGIDATVSTEEFRRRATQKAEDRFTQGALKRCQLSCETLDMQAGVGQPEMPWFWPERQAENDASDSEKSDNSDDEEEEEFTPSEKLELLISYLRTSYTFCFWCGIHYKDQADMSSNCPGLTRDDH